MNDLFNATPDELSLLEAIAKRAAELYLEQYDDEVDEDDIIYDIEACHCNGCALNLEALLNSSNQDFMHDIEGINDNLNRETGKLENCFLPRHSVPSKPTSK